MANNNNDLDYNDPYTSDLLDFMGPMDDAVPQPISDTATEKIINSTPPPGGGGGGGDATDFFSDLLHADNPPIAGNDTNATTPLMASNPASKTTSTDNGGTPSAALTPYEQPHSLPSPPPSERAMPDSRHVISYRRLSPPPPMETSSQKSEEISFVYEDTGPGYNYQPSQPPVPQMVSRGSHPPPPPSTTTDKPADSLIGMEVPLLVGNGATPDHPERGDQGSLYTEDLNRQNALFTMRDCCMALLLIGAIVTGGVLIAKNIPVKQQTLPTLPPTVSPLAVPTTYPTKSPTGTPIGVPTMIPTITVGPSVTPSVKKSHRPTRPPVTPPTPPSPPAYCGASFNDAAACHTKCLTNFTCPETTQTCYKNVDTCTVNMRYCGVTEDEAKGCGMACPSGEDFECVNGAKCFVISECSKEENVS